MKLSYSTLAAALFSTLSVSAFAGDVSIYGKANLTFNHQTLKMVLSQKLKVTLHVLALKAVKL